MATREAVAGELEVSPSASVPRWADRTMPTTAPCSMRAGGAGEGIQAGEHVADPVVIRLRDGTEKEGLLTTVKDGRKTFTNVR
jgi:alpha-D-ribose 1-methylphosphonate 5-triphosphate synthase subunit PhnG